MLTGVRRSLTDKDQGFTLIELLVVIIIIGILASIAIPLFLNQRASRATGSDHMTYRSIEGGLQSTLSPDFNDCD